MNEDNCCESCRNAKPKSPCTCRCGGKHHAENVEKDEQGLYQTINENLGGEVGEFIQSVKNNKMKCFGTCYKVVILNQFMGYAHAGGLSDKEGNRWWVFYECPNCGYQTSFTKIQRRSEIVQEVLV